MIYCVELTKDFPEDNAILHYNFDKEPTLDDIVDTLRADFYSVNLQYDNIEFYKVDIDNIERINL